MRSKKKQKGGNFLRCQASTNIGNQCKNRVYEEMNLIVDGKEVKNIYFCKHHITKLKDLTEYIKDVPEEEYYSPHLWNNILGLQETHNCYIYALNEQVDKIINACKNLCFKECKYSDKNLCNKKDTCPNLSSKCRKWKPQPGRFRNIYTSDYTCPDMVYRTIADNPKSYISSFNEDCKKGFRKISVVVNPGDGYHYYRRNRSRGGVISWSDKPGSTPVGQVDSNGKIDINPLRMPRNYPGNPYPEFCNFMCIPKGPKNVEYKPNKDNINDDLDNINDDQDNINENQDNINDNQNNNKYDKNLIDKAKNAISGRRNGRISEDNIKNMVKNIKNESNLTKSKHSTLNYILKNFNLTNSAKEYLIKYLNEI